ncbi:hypothetical protein OBJ92_09020 [Empedobacter falsenii]
MITIIKDLFIQSGLIEQQIEIGSIFTFEDADRKSYWLIIETERLDEVINNQAKYFEESKRLINNEWFDKNVSLLILHNVVNFNNIQDLVMNIEEDPYLFKKQVILYKESEYQNLVKILELEDISIKDFLENKLLEESTFKVHKENINNNSYESLLYRLSHKIPIINLSIKQEDNLEALTTDNKEKIVSRSLDNINDIIEQDIFNRDLENIKLINSDEIYDLLLTTLSTDEN